MTKFGYRPRHFKLYELVGPELYNKYKHKPEYLWRLLDDKALEALDVIREHYGKSVTINNWYWKGSYKESGLRDFNTKTGATLSAHKFGRAFDVKVKDVAAGTFQQDIIRNRLPKKFYELINCVERPEKTPTWTHIARLNYVTSLIVWV